MSNFLDQNDFIRLIAKPSLHSFGRSLIDDHPLGLGRDNSHHVRGSSELTALKNIIRIIDHDHRHVVCFQIVCVDHVDCPRGSANHHVYSLSNDFNILSDTPTKSMSFDSFTASEFLDLSTHSCGFLARRYQDQNLSGSLSRISNAGRCNSVTRSFTSPSGCLIGLKILFFTQIRRLCP